MYHRRFPVEGATDLRIETALGDGRDFTAVYHIGRAEDFDPMADGGHGPVTGTSKGPTLFRGH